MTFVVCDDKKKPDFQRPTDVYHGLIHDGFERGLPTMDLDMAMQRFDTHNQPFFVYGTLMSGQSRFTQLEPYVRSTTSIYSKVYLHLRVRPSGMELGDGVVHGQLMELEN